MNIIHSHQSNGFYVFENFNPRNIVFTLLEYITTKLSTKIKKKICLVFKFLKILKNLASIKPG